MSVRRIARSALLAQADTCDIIEAYPNDKYMPSCLIAFGRGQDIYHAVVATDFRGGNIRIVTVYRPDPKRWDITMKQRRPPR